MGFSFEKLLVILFVAAILIGPEHLPKYAAWLGSAVRKIRDFSNQAKDRLQEEMGDEKIEWQDLDPRQYDPRRIIREALVDDGLPPVQQIPDSGVATAVTVSQFTEHVQGTIAPFDTEAT